MDDTKTEEEIIIPEEETLELDLEDTKGEYVPPTKEEYEALQKKLKTVQAQKEHFRSKAGKQETKPDTSSDNVFTREEAVLIAQGMDLDDLDKLKGIQKGLGLKSFKEALDSDLWTAYSEKKKADAKREKASLGASGGSGKSSELTAKSDMSEEEHRKLWEAHYKK